MRANLTQDHRDPLVSALLRHLLERVHSRRVDGRYVTHAQNENARRAIREQRSPSATAR
jgi:hypothetical protein